jgi:hypothetical protein
VATTFLEGSPSALTAAFGFSANVQVPVEMPLTAGTAYYFRIRNLGSTEPLTASLQLSLTRAPNTASPSGALAINDDSPGWPLVLLSPTTGAVLQARPFPAGETGTGLPNGMSVWHDAEASPQVLRLYDAMLAPIATAAWTFHDSSPPTTNNRSNRFYLGDPGVAPSTFARVTSMSMTGVLGATVWTLPDVGLRAIGVSRDEAVLYHTGQSTGAGAIQRWDLVHDAPLTNLGSLPVGYVPVKDILVLLDDTIVVAGATSSSPYDSVLRQYAADGTVLHDYNLGITAVNRLTFALDDPASVWVWSFRRSGASLTGVSQFQNIRLTDGVALTTIDNPRYEGGAYRPAVPAPPPPAPDFGHAPSCPFLVLISSLPGYEAPGDGGGGDGDGDGGGDGGGGGGGEETPGGIALPAGYHYEARAMRRLRRAPHLAQENVRVVYRKFELDLERGVGLASGQGSDPEIMVRLSRDGGHTWSEPVRMGAGALGAYTTRAIARRLGQARDAVFEVTVSDPVAWSLVGAWLDLEPGTS